MKNYLVINSNNSLAENKKKSMTIPGVSNWFEWTWPIEGEDAGYIKARAMPNIGNWTSFSPAQIQKFAKSEVNQPSPQVSESTEPKSPWKIPIPHASGNVPYIGCPNISNNSLKIFNKLVFLPSIKKLDTQISLIPLITCPFYSYNLMFLIMYPYISIY
jgi:hypothetical protein